MINLISLLLLPLSLLQTEPQYFFRIRTDFVIKAKSPTGEQQLTVGELFYDKNVKQIIYRVSFPEKEIWVQKDTLLYKIVDSKVVSKQHIPAGIEFSIYNLVLNGNLADYGLRKTRFKIKKVEKGDGSVISTWEPPAESKKYLGDILLSNVNQQLNGIVFKNNAGEIITRQFFRNYIKVKGLLFPQEIVKENYVNGQKVYELTTFTNILINDLSGENIYNYKIPAN
ncbi:MAG: hypothetical protein ABR927_08355 [Bacteroidales bacterium]